VPSPIRLRMGGCFFLLDHMLILLGRGILMLRGMAPRPERSFF
jgi:hypothetical protein